MARWVKSHNQMRIFKQTATPAVVDGLKIGDIWIDINSGAILKVCTAISPVTFAVDALDANGNFSANNFLPGYTRTATAAGTTTLTVASTQVQIFTGSTTQTVTLPVVSTLALGTSYIIVNLSSGVVTVNSSGANAVQAMQANSTLEVMSNAITGTTAAVWDVTEYVPAASGQTGSGSLVRATSPVLVTPALGAASATSLSFSSTSGIIGSTTNDSAAAGSVGEVISSIILGANLISLTTATSIDITSISLTAGDWEVWGNLVFSGASSTVANQLIGWINNTSAAFPDLTYIADYSPQGTSAIVFTGGNLQGFVVPTRFFKLPTTTTIYLTTYMQFNTSTANAYGTIHARRVR